MSGRARLVASNVPAPQVAPRENVTFFATEGDIRRRRDRGTLVVLCNDL